jgi:predicted enzyme related to lactoylglutathione lyase
MFARVDHVAVFSHDYCLNAKFYEAVFGLKILPSSRARGAILLSDGGVGFNHVPVRTGFPTGLNHFGLQVEDVHLAIDRIKSFDPSLDVMERPETRGIIAFSAHDPDGNIFDLGQRSEEHAQLRGEGETSIHASGTISHYAIRSRAPERLCDFFATAFELTPLNRRTDDLNFYLTDGRLTLVFIPWSVKDYGDQDAIRPGPDHLGMRVESIESLKRHIEELVDRNPHLRPWPLGGDKEGKARLALFKRASPYAADWMTDAEGVHLAVSIA